VRYDVAQVSKGAATEEEACVGEVVVGISAVAVNPRFEPRLGVACEPVLEQCLVKYELVAPAESLFWDPARKPRHYNSFERSLVSNMKHILRH
jgi:hypothetical protein